MTPERIHHAKRLIEAELFLQTEPVSEARLSSLIGEDVEVGHVLDLLHADYRGRGIELCRRGEAWALRTAPDLAEALEAYRTEPKKLSRAVMETLSIIAYHQPATRADIEEIRGVSVSSTVLGQLLDLGWVAPRGRRQAPGRPLTYGVTTAFFDHFGLSGPGDLPGYEELKAAGLLEAGGGRGLDLAAQTGEPETEHQDDLGEAHFTLDFLDGDSHVARPDTGS
jgi:segregation and condensation protein B